MLDIGRQDGVRRVVLAASQADLGNVRIKTGSNDGSNESLVARVFVSGTLFAADQSPISKGFDQLLLHLVNGLKSLLVEAIFLAKIAAFSFQVTRLPILDDPCQHEVV